MNRISPPAPQLFKDKVQPLTAESEFKEAARKFLNQQEVPNEFKCPVSLDLMVDPVTPGSGFTYDRKSLKEWAKGKRNTDPLVPSEVLDLKDLRPNRNLRSRLEAFKTAVHNIDPGYKFESPQAPAAQPPAPESPAGVSLRAASQNPPAAAPPRIRPPTVRFVYPTLTANDRFALNNMPYALNRQAPLTNDDYAFSGCMGNGFRPVDRLTSFGQWVVSKFKS